MNSPKELFKSFSINSTHNPAEPYIPVASWEISPGNHIALYSHVNWFNRKMIKICFGWKYNKIES